jgi:lysophospholipase
MIVRIALAALLLAAPSANAAGYDGASPKSFRDFVAAHGEPWPVPAALATFTAADGKKIRYAHWTPEGRAPPAGTVVFFQGRTEFIEKNIDTYADLTARGYDVWTLDWRGQGLSDRLLPDREKGHIDSYDSYLRDADQFLTDIVRLDQQPRPRILLAHSMGGGIGTLYLERHPGRFDKAVFTSPLIRLPARQDSWLLRLAAGALVAAGHGADCAPTADCSWTSSFKAGFDPCAEPQAATEADLLDPANTSRYTHDPERLAHIECWVKVSGQALAVAGATTGWLKATYAATDEIAAHRGALSTPLLIVGGGGENDPARAVVSNPAQREICTGSDRPCCRVEIPGAGHEILVETDPIRRRFLDYLDAFVRTDLTPRAFCARYY